MPLKEAEIKDAAAIATVQVNTWQTTYTGQVPQQLIDEMSVEGRTDKWSEILSESKTKTFVIEENELIIGFVNCGPTRDKDKNPESTAEILAIYLEKGFQGRGFGKKLFQTALTYFNEAGFKEFTLWVLDKNSSTQKFYESMGMVADGEVKEEKFNGHLLSEVRYVGFL